MKNEPWKDSAYPKGVWSPDEEWEEESEDDSDWPEDLAGPEYWMYKDQLS